MASFKKITYERLKKILERLPKLDYEDLLEIEILDNYEDIFWIELKFKKHLHNITDEDLK